MRWKRYPVIERPRGRAFGLLVVLSICAVFACNSVSAFAARGHVFSSTFAESGSEEGQLNGPDGIAINEATGDIYVADTANDRVERFGALGEYQSVFNGSGTFAVEESAAPTGTFSNPEAIAIDNSCTLHKPVLTVSTTPTCEQFDPSYGDVYVADVEHNVIDKFSASGRYLGQIISTAGGESLLRIFGVAVDSNGRLWVYAKGHGTSSVTAEAADYSSANPNQFIASRELDIASNALPTSGFAVDSHDNLYVHRSAFSTDVVAMLTEEGVLLNDAVDDEAPTGISTELSNDDVYIDHGDAVKRLDSKGAEIEEFGQAHLINGKGLAVNISTGNVYVADATVDKVFVFSPEPPGVPGIESEFATDVSSNAVTLSGGISPKGVATEFYFEYGTTAEYGTSIPVLAVEIGSDFEVHPGVVRVQGLSPKTTYHFRVVARNGMGIVYGTDREFTTEISSEGSAKLLDGRHWELVSPANKHGASIDTTDEGFIASSLNGQGMTYLTSAPTEASAAGYANRVQVLSRRQAGAWRSEDIATRHELPTSLSIGQGQEYRYFSDDLSTSIVEPRGEFTSLSPEASERTPYLRVQSECEGPEAASKCYQPLATRADTAEGRRFDGIEEEFQGAVRFVGATSDDKFVVVSSKVPLLEEPAAPGALYEWSSEAAPGKRLALVSVLPGEEAGVNASLGSGIDAINAISADGSRVIWSSNGHLYLRDVRDNRTGQIDVVQPGGSGAGPVGAEFWAAASDGSKIFFTDPQQLTSSASTTGSDLYECEIVDPGGEPGCELNDLARSVVSGQGAEVQGVMGTSSDQSVVYVVARGVLVESPNDMGAKAARGQNNLYELKYEADKATWGTPVFIETLGTNDTPDWHNALASHTSRVSPNGRYLAFMSSAALTGYDNLDTNSGKPDEEVFQYDSSGNHTICVSCNPSGVRPTGVLYNEELLLAGQHIWSPGTWIAANVPAWKSYEVRFARYQSRYLSDDGRLFFNTDDTLASEDVNGNQDVYEHEPTGVGNCDSVSATFHGSALGCIGLASSGVSGEESIFVDADEAGSDLFLLTAEKLATADFDTSFDIYDAHECGASGIPCIEVGQQPPPLCASTDSCRSAPTPQPTVFGAPPSATFVATGTTAPPTSSSRSTKQKSLTRAQKLEKALKQCKKDKKKKRRQKCESGARSRYGAVSKSHKSGKKGKGSK